MADDRRYYGLDALRGIMMLLGVVLHSATLYIAAPPPHLPIITDPNTSLVMDGIVLAARADPGDGRLDIVLVTERERDLLDRYLAAEERGDSRAAALPARRGRSLQIEWSGFAVHIDDKPWPTRRRSDKGTIEISLYGDGVEFLVPA